MGWTDERVELLTGRWADGASCSVIAAELGGVTRNGVIGKVFRLGLPKRTSLETARGHQTVRPPRPPRRRGPNNVERSLNSRAASKDKVHLPINLSLDEFNALIPAEQRKSFFELTHWTCRWPVGNPGESGFFFCGGLPAVGYQYCPQHCGFAHQEYRR